MTKPPKTSLTKQQILQLAAEACVDPRTIARIYDGQQSKMMVLERVADAAKTLKIPAPPKSKAG